MPRRLEKSDEYALVFNQLIELCNRNNTSVTALIDEYTSSTSAMATWKKGNINTEIIPKLALKLNVSLDYLLTGKDNIPSPNQLSDMERELLEYFNELPQDEQQQLIGMAKLLKTQFQTRNDNIQAAKSKPIQRKPRAIEMTTIRKYNYPVGAGINTPPDKDDDYLNIKLPDEYVPYHANSILRVSGDSMEPDYPNGSWVWVNMKYPCERHEYMGKVVIANNHGELLLKIAEEDGLHSINEIYPVIKELEYCEVIGIVIDVAEDRVVDMVEGM